MYKTKLYPLIFPPDYGLSGYKTVLKHVETATFLRLPIKRKAPTFP